MRLRRRLGMLVAALVAAAGIPLLAAGPAHAGSYRYWSYWHGARSACVPNPSPGWNFAGTGPAGCPVKDGDVEGWRFAVSPNARGGAEPRSDAGTAFSQLCGNEEQPAGKVRVALVVDYGTTADAPAGDHPPTGTLFGDCFVVPSGATGADLLRTAGVSTRQDASGLICALSGYPKVGCGEAVADPVATPTRSARPTRTVAPTRPTTRASARPATGPSTPRPGATGASATASGPHSPSASGAAASGTASAAPGPSPSPITPTATAAGPAPGAGPVDPDASPILVVGLPVAASSDSGTPWAAGLVLLVVAALGAGAYLRSRRARRSR